MPQKIGITFFFALFFLTGHPCPAADRRVEHVFVISFDAGKPSAIQAAGNMPTFQSLAAAGAHTWNAYTIVPSNTLPAHASMLTGVGIQKHQVDWNDWLPEKGMIPVPTIFSLAKQKGLVTAIFAGKEKFKHFNLPGSVDLLAIPGDAKDVAKVFSAELERLKPNLVFLHFNDIDSAAHKYGWGSPEQIKAMGDCDEALKNVVAAITAAKMLDSSVIILSADHGGHDRTAEENQKRAAKGEPAQPGTHGSSATVDVEIPWIAWGAGVKKGSTITPAVVTYDTAATALWLLGVPIPEDFWGRPVTTAFTP